MTTADTAELLKPADLAAKLGVSPAQVMEWRRQFNWPHVRIGRKFYWTPAQVEAITKLHTVTASGKVAPADGRTTRSASRRRS